ncbi:MAG: SIR2 family protein [Methylobacter sp.]|nr:SIR2 family protein [Methylobacter sp.]
MRIEDAIKHAIDGNALLFLGSGFSVEATPIKGDKFLTGRKLAVHLYKECGIDPPPNEELNYAAQIYEKRMGAEKLVEELQNLFTASEVYPHHERFAEINWQAIYTTNYDDVIEKSFSKRKKKINPITPDKDTPEYTSKKNVCIHINGYIDTLTTETLNQSFKLTNTSYLTESFSKSNWSFMFRRFLESCQTIIFIGYSLYDIDIQRIIYSDGSLKEKIIFIESADKKLEDFEYSVQEEFGKIEPIGIDGFWKKYDEIFNNYKPQKIDNLLYTFDEIKAPKSITDFRYDDVFDLLFKGEYKLEHIWNCVHNSTSNSYFIIRDKHEVILNKINTGLRNVFIHSDIANGKTLFLLGLSCKLISNGYRVFWLKDDVEGSYNEINYIASLDAKIAIIVENFPRRTEEIKYINLKRSNNLVLLISAKTSLYEFSQERLSDLVEPKSVVDINLNKLCNREVSLLNGILRKYKFWGERDDWPESQQEIFIKTNCSSEFSSVLLEIIKSPYIKEKFSSLFNAFHSDNALTDVVTASVLKLLEFNNPSENMISELIDSHYLRTLEFKRNPVVKELLTLSNDRIVPRSSVIAMYGLTSFSDNRKLVERLVKITKNAHHRGSIDKIYFGIYVQMVNYGVLQAMLPKKGIRDAVIRFYEGIQNLSSAQNHPHFLLQYAIARLSYDEPDDLAVAKQFLDSAYAQAKKRPSYHTRHMDNVKARYLIKHSITLSDLNDAIKELVEAHEILIKQMRTEKSDAPYKVAQQYLKFYNDKKRQLDPEKKKKLMNMCEDILEYVSNLDETMKKEKAIGICKSNLDSLVKDIASSLDEA